METKQDYILHYCYLAQLNINREHSVVNLQKSNRVLCSMIFFIFELYKLPISRKSGQKVE